MALEPVQSKVCESHFPGIVAGPLSPLLGLGDPWVSGCKSCVLASIRRETEIVVDTTDNGMSLDDQNQRCSFWGSTY